MANGKGIENLDKELETLYQPKAAQKAALKKAAPKAKKKAAATKKPILSKGKRKKSVARAALLPGSGRITLNGVDMALVK
ncbi:MAG: hypothetical protein KGH64_06450, partial [Candidatus Micrarchaeota archaeon]|nr:hypothetical protein [Candidatus Micrarchaeota archaeon]